MNFASVMIPDKKGDRNLAVKMLEKGLVKNNLIGDNVSKYLEDLLLAEKKAQDNGTALHGKKTPPAATNYIDLVHNPKQAKQYEAMFNKRNLKVFSGVIEYCFSGMRFKVRLNDEGCCIGLNLFGVKTMDNDPNQPTLMEYSNDAKKLAHQNLYQRDVQVELCFTDKRGSFFGYITTSDKKYFATKLIEAGLAKVHYQGDREPKMLKEFSAAQGVAKEAELGIWSKSLKLMSGNVSSANKFKQDERISVEMSDLTDGKNFHLRLTDSADAAKIDEAMESFEPATADPMERPIKAGSLCAAQFTDDGCWYRARITG